MYLSTGRRLFVEVGYYLAFKHLLKYAGHDFILVPYYPSTPADLQSFTETDSTNRNRQVCPHHQPLQFGGQYHWLNWSGLKWPINAGMYRPQSELDTPSWTKRCDLFWEKFEISLFILHYSHVQSIINFKVKFLFRRIRVSILSFSKVRTIIWSAVIYNKEHRVSDKLTSHAAGKTIKKYENKHFVDSSLIWPQCEYFKSICVFTSKAEASFNRPALSSTSCTVF